VADVITSPRNDTIRAVARLATVKGRRATGHILIEGPNLFEAAVKAGLVFDTVLATQLDRTTQQRAATAGIEVTTVTDEVLAAASDVVNPRSPVASAERPAPVAVPPRNIVVLHGVADPGNAGTIIRTAAAFGWAVASTPDSVDLWSPKTLRAGAGYHFTVPIAAIDDIASLAATHTVLATVPRGGGVTFATDRPVALLVGSEAHGLPASAVAAADALLTIPMPGDVESLGVAVAAGIALHMVTNAT
jgi:TrmH family RNA methyltransferase